MKTLPTISPRDASHYRAGVAIALRTGGFDFRSIALVLNLGSKERARAAVAKGRRLMLKRLEETI